MTENGQDSISWRAGYSASPSLPDRGPTYFLFEEYLLGARPILHISRIKVNQPDATVLQAHYLTFFSLNMFRAPPRPSSGAYN
jgi:hypothetical protein